MGMANTEEKFQLSLKTDFHSILKEKWKLYSKNKASRHRMELYQTLMISALLSQMDFLMQTKSFLVE